LLSTDCKFVHKVSHTWHKLRYILQYSATVSGAFAIARVHGLWKIVGGNHYHATAYKQCL